MATEGACSEGVRGPVTPPELPFSDVSLTATLASCDAVMMPETLRLTGFGLGLWGRGLGLRGATRGLIGWI